METLQDAFLSGLGTVLVAIIGFLTQKAVKWLDEKGVTEQLQKKRYLVDIAVNAAEQIYQNEDGATKLANARTEALKLLNDNGLNITEDELTNFVEAAVKAMNDGVNSTKSGVIELDEGGE